MNHLLAFIGTITITQLIAHALGDYMLQSGWMALNKTKSWIPATVHGVVYAIPFILILHPSAAALAVIVGTHVVIDRFRLAKYICWGKEWLSPRRPRPWKECSKFGFDPQTPDHMAEWLMIIVDNMIHILINGLALYFL